MKSNVKFFKNSKYLPVDRFFNNVLYDKKDGYYNSKKPFGEKGDFITSPKISNLFSEMIAIWIVATWEIFGKPKNFNIVELGPGDGSLIKILIKVFKNFPEFNKSKKIFLLEKSNFLAKIQKKNLKSNNIRWIKNFNDLKKGPVIFFGNEFFDAIPIKQFKRKDNILFEKYYSLNKDFKIKSCFKKASITDFKSINSFKSLRNLQFIEYPKSGLDELKKIIKKVKDLEGCVLLIDYGYLKPNNQDTLQSVLRHKKNPILKNIGKADVTSHVNFALLKEFFVKNKLKVKNTISQSEFLLNLGIKERAEIVAKKMKFTDQANLFYRLKRLISPKSMGTLFKVNLAYNYKYNKFIGFK